MADSVPVSNSKYVAVSFELAALGTAKTRGVCSPVSGTVVFMGVGVHVVVDGDNIITPSINGTAITGGALTLTTAEVAGKTKQSYPSAARSVKRGDYLAAATDGGGTVGDAIVTFLIEQD